MLPRRAPARRRTSSRSTTRLRRARVRFRRPVRSPAADPARRRRLRDRNPTCGHPPSRAGSPQRRSSLSSRSRTRRCRYPIPASRVDISQPCGHAGSDAELRAEEPRVRIVRRERRSACRGSPADRTFHRIGVPHGCGRSDGPRLPRAGSHGPVPERFEVDRGEPRRSPRLSRNADNLTTGAAFSSVPVGTNVDHDPVT